MTTTANTPTTDLDLDAIEARIDLAAATRRSWADETNLRDVNVIAGLRRAKELAVDIAPALVAEVRRLRAELDQWKATYGETALRGAQQIHQRLADALDRAHRAETDAAQMTRANQEITAERDRMRAVAGAALQWRRHYGNTSEAFGNACTALVAAVDALPEEVTR